MSSDTGVTQEALDSLLASLGGTRESEARPRRASGRGIHEVRIHDFARSQSVSRTTLQMLESAYASFARLAGLSLAAQVHVPVHVSMLSLEQFAWEQFVRSVPDPTIMAIVDIAPLPGRGVLELNPSIGFWIIDRLLGGEGEIQKTSRTFTDLEQAVIEGPMSRLLSELCGAWRDHLPAEFELLKLIPSAADAQIAKPADAVVAAFFEVSAGPITGMASFCLPMVSFILHQLHEADTGSPARRAGTAKLPPGKRLTDTLRGVRVSCSARLGEAPITAGGVAELQEGDLVLLDTSAGEPLVLYVGNEARFRCRPISGGQRLAVEILGGVGKI